MITLEFSSAKTVGGYAVELATRSWCAHVGFVLPNGLRLDATPDHGVAVGSFRPAPRVERYAVDAPDSVLDAAMTQLGKPYDWSGVIGWWFDRNWQAEDSWFCSELIAWAFERAGVRLLRADDLARITPRDILLSPLLRPAS